MQHRPSARDLGIPFDGQPGPHNAITDVPGVEVGHTTLIEGDGPLVIGQGPIRTGVTAIHPLGKEILGSVAAGWFPFNGNGEMTGTTWIEESGCLEGPILLTNTVSIGTVRDAVIKWARKKQEAAGTFNPNEYGLTLALPVVAETWDGGLNDIFGFHVREEHVAHPLDTAQSGPVPQGNVGGGTGMTCYDFKGGIGSSSRIVRGLSPFSESAQKKGTVPFSAVGSPAVARSPDRASVLSRSPDHDTPIPSPQSPVPSPYVVGVLVQANHGNRSDLLIRGVPVGRELPVSEIPSYRDRGLSPSPRAAARSSSSSPPTPRCSLTNSSAWPAAQHSDSAARGPSATTAPETSSWPFRPPGDCPLLRSGDCPHLRSLRSKRGLSCSPQRSKRGRPLRRGLLTATALPLPGGERAGGRVLPPLASGSPMASSTRSSKPRPKPQRRRS